MVLHEADKTKIVEMSAFSKIKNDSELGKNSLQTYEILIQLPNTEKSIFKK
jgi:hypothetical protein